MEYLKLIMFHKLNLVDIFPQCNYYTSEGHPLTFKVVSTENKTKRFALCNEICVSRSKPADNDPGSLCRLRNASSCLLSLASAISLSTDAGATSFLLRENCGASQRLQVSPWAPRGLCTFLCVTSLLSVLCRCLFATWRLIWLDLPGSYFPWIKWHAT